MIGAYQRDQSDLTSGGKLNPDDQTHSGGNFNEDFQGCEDPPPGDLYKESFEGVTFSE